MEVEDWRHRIPHDHEQWTVETLELNKAINYNGMCSELTKAAWSPKIISLDDVIVTVLTGTDCSRR